MTGCLDCGARTQNDLCQVCRVGKDRDLGGECSECGADVVLVEICDDCSDTAKAARSEGAGTIITGPDAEDRHVVGGDDDA